MKIPALLAYLLANRHRLTGDTIADCIDLAIMASTAPGRRVQWDVLARRWGCSNRRHVFNRLRRLAKAGLLDYEAGVSGDPGYLFTRVGPA